MSQSYVYSIATDFPNHRICPETLEDSIQTNILSASYEYMNVISDACMLFFSALLSEADVTLLLSIINTHTGNPPPLPAQEVLLVGDSDAGVARVAVQGASIPSSATSFVLGVSSEMSPGQTIETVSDPIPEGGVLRLLFARATCKPVEDVNHVKNTLLVELLYREVWESETYDHLFGKSYLDVECQAPFSADSKCWDGVEMVGDGVDTVFVIRRTVFGEIDDQDTMVAVRGYIE